MTEPGFEATPTYFTDSVDFHAGEMKRSDLKTSKGMLVE